MAGENNNPTPAVDAYSWQGEGSYQGADLWRVEKLEPGDKLVQLDFDRASSSSETASKFFTTYEELEKHIDPQTGKVDIAALSERLQVGAYRPTDGAEFNHSPKVTVYEVTDEVNVASARVTDNPTFGQGGAQQHYSDLGKNEIIKNAETGEGFLKKIDEVESYNTKPRLAIYDELKNIPNNEIADVVEKYHDEFIDALEQVNTPETNKVANDMIERQAFSETAREIKADPEAIRGVEIPNGNAIALDLDAKTLTQVERIRDEALSHGPDRGADGPDRSGSPDNGTPDRTPAALDDATRVDATTRISAADELGELRGFAATPDGSTSHLIDAKTSTIYTVTGDELTGVQKFDNSKDAGQAFGKLMGEAAQVHPEAFKGLPTVHSSLGALGNHIDDLGRTPWRKALGAFGEGAAEFGGKASKILGPLGVAAAGAEAYGLEMKLQDYEEFGLVPEEAMLAYRGILTAHTAQATVDPTLVGGEVAVQVAHDQWAKAYGIPDDVKEALEPGSLLEDVAAGKDWLEAQAMASGMEVKDYAVSRWNDPGKLGEDWAAIKDTAEDAAIAAGNAIGYAANTMGDYASSRWEEPSRLLDDAQAVGHGIGESVSNAASGAWNYLFGKEEPSALERAIESRGGTPPVVPYNQAVQQFSNDRETLRDMDPQSELPVTQAASHPEAEAMFVRLNNEGITQFPKAALEGGTPQERVSGILTQAREIDLDLMAEKGLSAATSEPEVYISQPEPEHEHAAGI